MPEHIRQEPKVLVSTENLTEQEWLAYRRQGIGGSDVAAILGISPFRTARDLYDDKLNIASAVDDTGNWVALEMGHLLEPLVAQIFTKKTGLEVFQIKKMFQHPQYPFMLADVDYFVRLPNGEIALLEIKKKRPTTTRKTTGGRTARNMFPSITKHRDAITWLSWTWTKSSIAVSMATMRTKPSSATCTVIGSTSRRWFIWNASSGTTTS